MPFPRKTCIMHYWQQMLSVWMAGCSLSSPLGLKWLKWASDSCVCYGVAWLGQGSLVWCVLCWAQRLCSQRKKLPRWGNADFLNPFSTFSPGSTHIRSFTSLGVVPRNFPSFAIRQPNKFPPVSVLENLVLVSPFSSASTPTSTSVVISAISLLLHPGVSFLFSSVAQVPLCWTLSKQTYLWTSFIQRQTSPALCSKIGYLGPERWLSG